MSGPVASGGCLCGDVRLEINGPLTDAHWCACRRCRQWAGSPAVGVIFCCRNMVAPMTSGVM